MLSEILRLLKGTVEWQNWGLNTITVSAIATAILMVMQAWGLWKQRQKVEETGSRESLSAPLFSFFIFSFFALFWYGVDKKSLAMALNGLLGFGYALVLLSMWKAEPFNVKERIVFWLSPFALLSMVFLPWKDDLLFIIFGISLVPLADQPWKIWLSKKAGALDLRFVAMFSVSAVFWTIYGFATKNWVLSVINPTAVVIMAVTVALWFKYRER